MEIQKQTRAITVRFKQGVPRELTNLSRSEGKYRATWIRDAVLQHAVTSPLSFTTAGGAGERILIRLTAGEFKTLEMLADKFRVSIGTYVRAVCMKVLEQQNQQQGVSRGKSASGGS